MVGYCTEDLEELTALCRQKAKGKNKNTLISSSMSYYILQGIKWLIVIPKTHCHSRCPMAAGSDSLLDPYCTVTVGHIGDFI